MSYQPPPGWVEIMPVDAAGHQRRLFHANQSCPRIQRAETLLAVDRPYSAPRCSLCAPGAETRTADRSRYWVR